MMRWLILILVMTIGLLSNTLSMAEETVSANHLRCEYRDNPLGIDSLAPRLSWRIESEQRGMLQSAYRIRVASESKKLDDDKADLWDTGKVQSNQTLHVEYAGKPLTSRQTCYWDVQVWDAQDQPGKRSTPAMWSMGLLESGDWKADYISFKDETPIATDTDSFYLPPARQY
jgi:alpha-L-rhamnosidase